MMAANSGVPANASFIRTVSRVPQSLLRLLSNSLPASAGRGSRRTAGRRGGRSRGWMQTAEQPFCFDLARASVAVEGPIPAPTPDVSRFRRHRGPKGHPSSVSVSPLVARISGFTRHTGALRSCDTSMVTTRFATLTWGAERSDSRRVVHRLEHVVDQASDLVVDDAHRLGPAPQAWGRESAESSSRDIGEPSRQQALW